MHATANLRPEAPSRRAVLRHGVAALALIAGMPPSRAATPVLATRRFDLRSDARVNLHHFLMSWAAADGKTWPSYATPIVEREFWQALLDRQDRHAWTQALAAYAATADRDPVFDAGLIAVRDQATGSAPRSSVPDADQPLVRALDAALPLYLRHWWPAHDAQNRAWVQSVAGLLRKAEHDMARRLQAAWGAPWPGSPIPVDVVKYPNALGAYTTGRRITLSSASSGYRMPQSLEMLFHEASHLDGFATALERLIEDTFTPLGRKPPEALWHDMIFFTAGTITQLVLQDLGQPGYVPYGQFGVYQRGPRWQVQMPLFEQFWRPFLASASADAQARRQAFSAIAQRLD